MQAEIRKERLAGLVNAAQLDNEIDYILHVENELPMEWYTQLDKVKADLINLIFIHADEAVQYASINLKYSISAGLRDDIDTIVSRSISNVPFEKYDDVSNW